MSIEHLDDMHGLDCARHLIKTSSLQGLPFILFYCFFCLLFLNSLVSHCFKNKKRIIGWI